MYDSEVMFLFNIGRMFLLIIFSLEYSRYELVNLVSESLVIFLVKDSFWGVKFRGGKIEVFLFYIFLMIKYKYFLNGKIYLYWCGILT